MKIKYLYIPFISLLAATIVWSSLSAKWIVEDHNNFTLFYHASNLKWKNDYVAIIEKGIKSVETFFNSRYEKKFDLYIHPNRKSIDSQWQKDWKMPDFKSECWMVASGIANKMDLLSPAIWQKEACEHSYSDKKNTGRLITHELFHVFHGQLNASPDFSEIFDADWFVEGLATYASGQCDSDRITELKKALLNNELPKSLNEFWTGKYRYGLSGSVVMYIDKFYGRDKLKELLKFNKKEDLLGFLKTNEATLLNGWKSFIQNH